MSSTTLNRNHITNLDEFLEYSVYCINLNIFNDTKEKNGLVLLKLDLTYSDKVSNTHSCPRNGKTNWRWHNHLPKGYPGWKGRVWAFYSKQQPWMSSDVFGNSLIHTGSGGYGVYSIGDPIKASIQFREDSSSYTYNGQYVYPVSYGCEVFLDDLPAYKKVIEKEILIHDKKYKEKLTEHLLHGTRPTGFKPKYINKYVGIYERNN